ncbi:MAG TPA: hypothetical protein VK934_00080 [Fimbriimonas sp.]|nr:hypothetical protein [Fimbriimonas sp.]
MRGGFTYKEVLLALLVVLLAGGTVFLIGRSMERQNRVASDVDAMRSIYVSLALYESDLDGAMAPDLLAARAWMPNDTVYQSNQDPFAKVAGPFPIEPGLPTSQLASPLRISYSFLYAFASAGKAKVKPWPELRFDPLVGFLANEWQGQVEPSDNFQATVSGRLLRLNTDGALHVLDLRSRQLGDPQVLFFSK